MDRACYTCMGVLTNLSVDNVDNTLVISGRKALLSTLTSHVGIQGFNRISLSGATHAQNTNDRQVGDAREEVAHLSLVLVAAFLGSHEALEIVLDADGAGGALVGSRSSTSSHEVGNDGSRIDFAIALGLTHGAKFTRSNLGVTDNTGVSLGAASVDNTVTGSAIGNLETFVSNCEVRTEEKDVFSPVRPGIETPLAPSMDRIRPCPETVVAAKAVKTIE